MKVHKLALLGVAAFGLVIASLSGGFYTLQRAEMLRTVADSLNQSLFYLEENTRRALQHGHMDEVQSILDQGSAINDAVAVVSISTDLRTIEASSSRSRKGKPVSNEYLPLSQLHEALIKRHHTQFRSEFSYFEGTSRHEALLLVRINEGYVFGRLNQIAILYGIGMFLVLGFLSLVAYVAVRRTMIIPLETMTKHAYTGSTQGNAYFIDELTELDRTLGDSFLSMHHQQHNLQNALDESRFLDEMLRTIADINQLLITANTVEELITQSARRLAQHPGYASCWIALNSDDAITVRALSSSPSVHLSVGTKLEQKASQHADNPIILALSQSKPFAIDHLQQHSSQEAWYLFAKHEGYGSFIALPLLPSINEAPTGLLGLYTLRTDGFDPKEITMLEELAGDIGFAIRSFMQREQLEHHLTTDPITLLPNRVALLDRLTINTNVMLAIINIDRFSDINEVYGITIGDGILAVYGRWLTRLIKPYQDISLYKIGSDEYVLLFSECDNLARCRAFLEQLVTQSSQQSFVVDEIEIVLTVTIGMAIASEQILEHATAALKQAKLSHQSIAMYENASFKKDQENNIAWYKRIKEAIEDSRIVPFFQPIVDNKTQRIIKYEALIRLIEKDGSVISPHVFLGIAKKTKLYGQLTRIMFDKVIEQFKTSTLPVGINLSTEDLLNKELADYMEQLICSHQAGKILIFEILESEGIENYLEVSAFVDRFKSIGCHFAIDDFGSGYSNFDHLLKLNVDTLKIDGSLIKNLPHDRNTQIIVKHICDFASEMGISTVAEFVANEAIYQQVRDIGINASQGYYFYEPAAVPAEA